VIAICTVYVLSQTSSSLSVSLSLKGGGGATFATTTIFVGASKETAKQMLEVSHGNVEMAINMFLEDQDGASSSSQVRDPILPQREVLVEAPVFHSYPSRSKRAVHSVFDSFRDFQVETRKFVLTTNKIESFGLGKN
jgi:dsDNA-specific endonuclease/ATPase MutS2